MTSKLLNLAALVSLLLCFAVCALWVRSYFVIERVGRHHYAPGIDSEARDVKLMAQWGIAVLYDADEPGCRFPQVRWEWDRSPAHPARIGSDGPPTLRAFGIGWSRKRVMTTGATYRDVRVRLALPAFLFALPAIALAARRWRTTRPRPAGLCLACGYDLRATPARCPECGAAPARVATAAA